MINAHDSIQGLDISPAKTSLQGMKYQIYFIMEIKLEREETVRGGKQDNNGNLEDTGQEPGLLLSSNSYVK